jgi:hypothetical protein
MPKPLSYSGAVIIAVAVGAIAISGQSFWIDEGTSAIKAIQPDLHGWWRELRADGSSNLQLPLHFFYLWLWEKIFGGSEIALRAANGPPLALAFCAIVWGLRARPRWQFWFIILASINAFTWYYMNEARPYILLFAGCCITFACLARAHFSPGLSREQRTWFFALLTGSLMVCATSSIAVPWALASVFGAALVLGRKPFIELVRRHLLCSCLWLLSIFCLGIYYLWAICSGATPTDIGRTGLFNLGFIVYEQFGLAGLGPGRIELREGVKSLLPYLPILSVGCLILALVSWKTLRFLAARWKKNQLHLWIAILVVLPFMCVLLAGWVGHARLWGRHFTPLFPFVLLGLAIGITQLLQEKTVISKILVAVALLAFSLSALEIRFEPRHRKDDYRSAAEIALRSVQKEQVVWWAADRETGIYYHLPLSNEAAAAYTAVLKEPSADDLSHRPEPQIIVLSKPDVYDMTGTIAQYARSHHYRLTHLLQAFEIWER